MKKQYAIALSLIISLIFVSLSTARATGAEEGTSAGAIGSTVADFKLPDVDGKNHTLASLKGKNGTVLIFVSTNCPVSNAYNERMEKLALDYKAKGVNVIGINSNSSESSGDIKAHAASNKLTFTILKDNGNKIADQLGAERTPEAYLLDATNKLVYRGRIDNARNSDTVSVNDLRDAIDAVVAGKAVAKSLVPAFGCNIKRS